MRDRIEILKDEEAIKLLSLIYSQHPSTEKASYDHDAMLAFVSEFMDAFEIQPKDSNMAEGEIAKYVLRLLMMDNKVIIMLNENLKKEQSTLKNFGYSADFGTYAGGIGVIAMALMLLRTYIKFTKDKNGKTTFEIRINPLGDKQMETFLNISKNLISNIVKTKDS